MAKANGLTTCCERDFVKMSLFQETNAAAVEHTKFEVITEFSEEISTLYHVKMLNFIKSLFNENSTSVQQINIDPSCVPHSSRFGKNCKIRVINDMICCRWHPPAIDCFLNFLVCEKRNFSLVIVFCEEEPSNNNESESFWEFRFTWCKTGFVCVVEEYKRDFRFRKDLVLVEEPQHAECHLASEKRKDLCITMDGEKVHFEPIHAGKNFVTVWKYYGKENDPGSRHKNDRGILTVFGFKLTSISSDTTKCLGAIDSETVGLMPPNVPPRKVVNTKADHRFFYHITGSNNCSMFESTQFENHYLAFKDSDKESVEPYLYLKHVPDIKETDYDEDILFQMYDKKTEVQNGN